MLVTVEQFRITQPTQPPTNLDYFRPTSGQLSVNFQCTFDQLPTYHHHQPDKILITHAPFSILQTVTRQIIWLRELTAVMRLKAMETVLFRNQLKYRYPMIVVLNFWTAARKKIKSWTRTWIRTRMSARNPGIKHALLFTHIKAPWKCLF